MVKLCPGILIVEKGGTQKRKEKLYWQQKPVPFRLESPSMRAQEWESLQGLLPSNDRLRVLRMCPPPEK
jgi:hypothetical protein